MSGPKIPNPAYRIETKRLVLRCWQPQDAALMREAAAASKEHLLPFMPWAVNEPESVESKIERIRTFRAKFDRGEDFVYGVFDRDETRVLGGSGLHTRIGEEGLEIGYWIHKDFIGQGLATELSAALTKVAFELNSILSNAWKSIARLKTSPALQCRVNLVMFMKPRVAVLRLHMEAKAIA
jgi:RimJ/RimL family protein N-acetyltransferase